jgi:hypothetical protein
MEEQREIRIMLSHTANYQQLSARCKQKLRQMAKFLQTERAAKDASRG